MQPHYKEPVNQQSLNQWNQMPEIIQELLKNHILHPDPTIRAKFTSEMFARELRKLQPKNTNSEQAVESAYDSKSSLKSLSKGSETDAPEVVSTKKPSPIIYQAPIHTKFRTQQPNQPINQSFLKKLRDSLDSRKKGPTSV